MTFACLHHLFSVRCTPLNTSFWNIFIYHIHIQYLHIYTCIYTYNTCMHKCRYFPIIWFHLIFCLTSRTMMVWWYISSPFYIKYYMYFCLQFVPLYGSHKNMANLVCYRRHMEQNKIILFNTSRFLSTIWNKKYHWAELRSYCPGDHTICPSFCWYSLSCWCPHIEPSVHIWDGFHWIKIGFMFFTWC